MGVDLRDIQKGAGEIDRLILDQSAERHKEFTGEVLKAAKDLARSDAYDTGTFHGSLEMKGTPGKAMEVGSTDHKPKALVIEYGSDALGRFPKYIMGRAIGLAFDREKTKNKGDEPLPGAG